MNYSEIINKLPYKAPFFFVDELVHLNENGAKGSYTFKSDADFYNGHFKGNPVTPGVLLTECCAQIGVVALGVYLMSLENGSTMQQDLQIGLSSSEMEFYRPVYPNELVTVTSEKLYYRFNKLKCKVNMHNEAGELVCKGTIAGMLKSHKNA